MKIIDWKMIGNYPRGKFALEFEVSEFDEDKIRRLINKQIETIQEALELQSSQDVSR